jgi:tetratricopeptide (TPR) repeat protein
MNPRCRGVTAVLSARLLLMTAVLCLASPATGDERMERIHQLWNEAGKNLREENGAGTASLVEEIIRLERQAGEVNELRLAESLTQLAQLRLAARDLDGAEALFLEAHRLYSDRLGPLNPFSGLLIGDLTHIYKTRGDLGKAAVALDRAVAIVPPVDVPSAVFCAAVYEALKEWEKARSALELAAKLAPDDPQVSNNLAWVLLSSPDPSPADLQRAERLAQSSVAAHPESVAAVDTLGLALVRVGRSADAARLLEKALEAPAESMGDARPFLEFHAALALEQSGNPIRAAALAQSAIDRGVSPDVFDPAPARELLARLTSRLPEHSGRLADAR